VATREKRGTSIAFDMSRHFSMVAVVDALSRERPSSCKRGSIGVHGQGNAPIRAGSSEGIMGSRSPRAQQGDRGAHVSRDEAFDAGAGCGDEATCKDRTALRSLNADG